ncbi:MAG: MaoC family dehydratase [Chloroflexi bacterium]|nr:MaoC family dehydratase [Chloroflexota bacterium]
MEFGLELSGLNEGMTLPRLKKAVTQQNINLYAQASRDFNPIHIDQDFAQKTSLGGTIAHGMLILAYISQMMTTAFGQSWLSGGKLNVRFRAPARPGDTIAVSGKIRQVTKSEDHTLISCEVLCANQNGESVITGETQVTVQNNEN